jgi:DNA polymerase III sliding clamp (beta) subunit (PCNA family)
MSKISLPVAELKPALTGLGKVVSKRATLPVLSHVKVERTKDGWIVLTGTDLDAFITYRLEQPSDGEQISLLVPYDELLKITKSCQKADTILIRTENNASELSVTIEYAIGSQVAETKVASLPVEEFPEIPRIKGDAIAVNDAVRQSIHEAMDCASVDETRLILNSAYIDVSKSDGHYVVGTNGSHLYSSNSFKLPMKESFVLPTHKFLEFKEFNHDGEWQLKSATPAHKDETAWFQLSSRRWRFIGRQIEGNYPNWRQVVPTEFATGIQFSEADKLAETIERLPDHDPSYHAIGIERKDRAVNLLWKPDKQSEWKRLPVTVDQLTGKDITIYLNRHYLTKALRFGLHRFDSIDSLSPVRFSNEGRQMIVMPVRPESAPPPPTPAPQAQETTPQQPAAPSTAAQQERTPMVTDTSTAPSTTAEPPPIDAQFDQLVEEVESMKTTMQDHLTGLKSVGSKLKSIQREHKSSTKDLQSVRQTLKGLQGLKL